MHKDLIPIIFGELISEVKICKNDSKTMSILQNHVRSTSRYVNILMDCGASASIIHDSFVGANKFNTKKNPRISGLRWLNDFLPCAKVKLK